LVPTKRKETKKEQQYPYKKRILYGKERMDLPNLIKTIDVLSTSISHASLN